ncbi:BRD4-interacting chromatin-remodeling complex-associated protein isoform X2 [Puntigrus tetrazona]|uniref:BRD4-interacting chromatin-remodeling complex-associated protein isoform X2 n=1 Tax=Puntigrus tetrazona TaxID=1606681 RepID=UPI001C89B90E|nr:BRD4-interacting chromatin-remodeling complex-associated protein isoform X2 [Puntigrus tetrazona]
MHTRFLSVCHPPSRARLPLLSEHVGTDGWRTGPSERTIKRKDAVEMEDEDGTCLFDVLCDPQALNDFLHGTNELPSGDLLINSSSGEPSLFTDTPSPASLLADDASSQDTPVSGCVDLSFLDEALLASPGSSLGSGDPEVQEDPNVQLVEQQKESVEICDILQQSLQEADITEDTLALEAGLAQTVETLQFGLSGTSIPLPSTPYFSKPLTLPGLSSLPKDTQTAVEPPQPSLLAVGPGCPSLKPPGTQLMSLLPGNVFPAPPLEASFSINSAQSTSMIFQKTLPTRQMLTSTIRTISPSGVMLQKNPLPIQPKLPVSIQPRLVQISPRPSGQKPLPGFAFISTNMSQSVFLPPSAGSKQSLQAQPAPGVNKPVSLNLVGQGGPIVIQPQNPFQGQRHFFLPSQTPATLSQSTGIPRCILSTPSNQVSNKPNVDSSHIVTVRPRQINFGPIFTSPTGQLTLKQGALLSGSLPIRSTPPTAFQTPTQLARTYAPQVQGQHAIVQNTVGNQITLINNANMLIPDITAIPVENGQSMIQSQPLVPQAQSAQKSGPDGNACFTQNSVLLFSERTTEDKQEKVNKLFQESRLLPPASVEAPVAEIHPPPSPVSTLLQSSPDISCTPETVLSLSPQVITQTGEQHFTEGDHNPLNNNQASVHPPQQYPQKPSASQDFLAATLLVQMDNHISAAVGEAEDSLTSLTASETFSSLCESEEILMPAYHGLEHTDILLQSSIGQCSVKTTDSLKSSTTSVSAEQNSSVLIALGADPKCPEGPVMSKSPSSSSEKLFMYPEHLSQSHVLTELGRTSESTCHEYKTQYSEHDRELTAPRNNGIISLNQTELQEKVHLGPRLLAQDKESYSALQKTPTASVDPKEENLRLTKKQHRFKQQMFLDHSAVLNPNTSAPFVSVEDALRHLLPYHTCARTLPNQADFISVDKQFECVSVVLFKRIKDMLNKYRKLLLTESQQESPSAEMVMLERLFLQSERVSLAEDRRKARRDPESFLMSRVKNSSQHSQVSSVQTGLVSCPPSPPSWTLQSDRPPGLKTYRSSSKGAIRLTIKQESGSRKVIHNSCDASHVISGFKRNYSGQLTKGGTMQGKGESLKPHLSSVAEDKNAQRPDQLNKMKLHIDTEAIGTGSKSQNLFDSVATQDCVGPRVQGSLPEQCTPMLKRNKLASSTAESPSLTALVEDGELSEHLQSALDSILELQRLQGSVAGVKPNIQQPCALDQTVSSILEGQL